MKVNTLLEHFGETRKHDGDISFTRFLIMHYLTDDGNTKDDERDQQLPFKSASGYIAGTLPVFIIECQQEFIAAPVMQKDNQFYIQYDSPVSSNFYNLVWNPPKA
jgi:hypothetical protein